MDLYLPRQATETPTMIFLSNFRELIRGKPQRGGPCRISYDPSRIVPAHDYDLATDAHDPIVMRTVKFLCHTDSMPVTAHLQFRPNGPVMDVPLTTHSGPLREGIVRRDGRGTMLDGQFVIPQDAQWMMVWFTHRDNQGNIRHDSDFGANYMFRFIEADLEVLDAAVEHQRAGVVDIFRCRVRTVVCVSSVLLRYRIVNQQPDADPQRVSLSHSETDEDSGSVIWATGDVSVPCRSVVAFDLIYFVGERSFKEDNQGAFFIVSEKKE